MGNSYPFPPYIGGFRWVWSGLDDMEAGQSELSATELGQNVPFALFAGMVTFRDHYIPYLLC